MDAAEKYKGNKRKSSTIPQENPIPFKIFKHLSEGKYSLKISKPNMPEWDRGLEVRAKDMPEVLQLNDTADNTHGLHIMCTLNNKNIVRVEAVGRTELQEGNEISIFIEKCSDNILSHCWDTVADSFGQIPSETFQTIIREIISAIDFLRRNGTYHGNLSWETTLFTRPYTVKLFGFTRKEMPLRQAQWEDWNSIVNMLQVVSNLASQNIPELICGDVDILIAMIQTSNMNSLPVMRDTILENVFFWTPGRRAKLMMTTVPELLKNSTFRLKIDRSAICSLPWDSNETDRPLRVNLADRFKAILDKCNAYRFGLGADVSEFDPDKKIDCLKLAYAAYTHKAELNDQVDLIFRAKFPNLFSEVQHVIDTM